MLRTRPFLACLLTNHTQILRAGYPSSVVLPCSIRYHYATVQYRHKPLQHNNHIRVVKVLSGDGEAPLRCEILERPRNSNDDFEALSYTWGDPILIDDIQEVNSGANIPITRNLADALRAFRVPNQDRHLWIDQICINQEYALEKGSQVAVMDEIYRGATKTLVWLGNEEAHHAMDELVRIGSDFESYGYKSVFPFPPTIWNQDYLKKFHHLIETCNAKALFELFSKSWFERVWVFQEFILAKDVIIRCGTRSVSYDLFSKALCVFFVMLSKAVFVDKVRHQRHTGVLDLITNPQFRRAWELVRRRERYVALQSLVSQGIEPQEAEVPWVEKEPKSPPLLQELYSTSALSKDDIQPSSLIALCITMQDMQCTIVQDRIYGVLAISLRERLLMRDYNMAPAALWKEVALKSLEAGDLTVLHYAGVDLKNFKTDVPTYAIDFSKPLKPRLQFGGETASYFNAGSEAEPEVEIVHAKAGGENASSHPRIGGYMIDRVTHATGAVTAEGEASEGLWSPDLLRKLYEKICEWRSSLLNACRENDLLKVLLRTVLIENAHPHAHAAAGSNERNHPNLEVLGLIALKSIIEDGNWFTFHELVAQAYGQHVSLGLRMFDHEEPLFYHFPARESLHSQDAY